jgi:putative FmdB family regulatory protein
LPTYGYKCESCGSQYEKREGFDAPAKQKCPACGKTANRMIFAPPIVFKGSGFYKTDSRGGDSGGESPPSTPASTPPAADHGHSHGPGGHTHGEPSTPAPPADTAAESTAAG